MTSPGKPERRRRETIQKTFQRNKTHYPHQNPMGKNPGGSMDPPRHGLFGTINQYQHRKMITNPSGKTYDEANPRKL